MKKHTGTLCAADVWIASILAGLAALLLWLLVSMVQEHASEQKLCQSVVPLGKLTYDEAFLDEASKMRGVRAVLPVQELSLQLKAEGYTAELTCSGVDLDGLQKSVRAAQDVSLGSVPALLLGEEALAGMTDKSGRAVSEKKQKELLRRFAEIKWLYRLAGEVEEENSAVQPGWKPCVVAGVLSEPKDQVFLDYEQARALAGYGAEIKKILLTVKGEQNYEQALAAFSF